LDAHHKPEAFGNMTHLHTIVQVVLLTALTVCAPIRAAEEDSARKLGLVLSGGGSRGLAQIGVLEALEELGVRPDLIVGTSMGAIVAALYAAGYSSIEIGELAKDIDWRGVLSNNAERPKLLVVQKDEPVDYLVELRFEHDLTPRLPTSMSHGQQIYNLLVRHLAPAQYHARNDFDSLPTPLRVVATDILSGRKVVISEGNIADAIRASCGVPMAFSPVACDSMLLMDGGLTANIPVDVARENGCEHIIAVNVTSPLWSADELDNPVRLMDQVVAIGIAARKAEVIRHADAVIQPDLEGIKNTDFTQINTLISRGYAAAKAALPAILSDLGIAGKEQAPIAAEPERANLSFQWQETDTALSQRFEGAFAACTAKGDSLPPRAHVQEALQRLRASHNMPYCRMTHFERHDSVVTLRLDPGVVHGISVAGNDRTSTRMVVAATNLHAGDIVRENTLPLAISTLYATGLFKTVNADMDTTGVVRIYVREKPYLRARLGLRYDQFLLGEGYLEAAYENLLGLGLSCILHLQYGLRREKYALELTGNHLISPWWANNVRIQGYIARESIIERTEVPNSEDSNGTGYIVSYREQSLRKAGVVLLIGTEIGKTAMVSGGVKFERFESFSTDGSVFASGLGPFERMRYFLGALTIDDLDRYPFPRRGHRHRITVGGAHDAISETESFIKLDGAFSYCFTLWKRHTLTPSARIAWATHTLPVVEKAYLGGAVAEERYRQIGMYNYVPFIGMRPRSLTGDILALVRLEYRLAVLRKLYAVVMFDWGYVWHEPEFAFDTDYLAESAQAAPLGVGAGLVYDSPVGPIRFWWGRLLRSARPVEEEIPSVPKQNVFYLSVGHDF